MARLLAVLPSVHDVLRVSKALARAGVWHDLVPKPTALSTDCGVVVELEERDRAAVVAATVEVGGPPARFFRVLVGERYEAE